MMNMFALGLEEVFQPREHLLLQEGVARLGYSDDLHLYGKISVLKRRWNMEIATLKEAGLEVQPTKLKFWSPSVDIADPNTYLLTALLANLLLSSREA